MNQLEGGKLTQKDKNELDNQIQHLTGLLEQGIVYGDIRKDTIKELRRLRRFRHETI